MGRILIVEDDEFFSMALGTIMEDQGHSVVMAENGAAAVAQLQSAEFDCVVSDLQMPQMSGLQLADWMRKNSTAPLIMMTGFSESIDTEKALALGAANIIFKPFSHDEVVQALNSTLAREGASPMYFSVATAIFAQGGMANFNLFAKHDDKLIKVISRGEIFDPILARLGTLGTLFTDRASLEAIAGTATITARAALKSEQLSMERKANILRGALEVVLYHIEATPNRGPWFSSFLELLEAARGVLPEHEITSLQGVLTANPLAPVA